VNEGTTASYTATATWSDGSTSTVTPTWSTNLGTISTSGVLSAPAVTADQTATVGASYSSSGVTRTASKSVTVVNVASTTGAIIPTPPDGARDVPVNTVITARVTGTTGISTLFNKDTFTLRPTIATGDSSVGPNGPLAGIACVSGGVVQGSFAYDAANASATFTPNCALANGETYAATVSTPSDPSAWQISTIPAGPDSDGDGVQDAEDDDPVNGKIATPFSPKGTGKLHIDVTGSAVASLGESTGISEDNARLSQAGRPAGYEFRDGLASFKVTGAAPGSTVTVQLAFPSGIPAGGKLYRVDASGFHEVPGVTIVGNTVTLTLTDGGQGDSDGQVNGIIVDPVGMASPTTPGSGSIDLTTGSSSGGGCSVVARGGPGGSGIDGVLIFAGLGVTVWGIRIRRRTR